MTQQEIQALINAKIAGQGSAVDVGGALPQILSGILEVAQAAQKPKLEIETATEDTTVEQVLALLEINGKHPTLEDLFNLEVGTVVSSDGYGEMIAATIQKGPTFFNMYFGFFSDNFGAYGSISLDLALPNEGNSSIKLFDI